MHNVAHPLAHGMECRVKAKSTAVLEFSRQLCPGKHLSRLVEQSQKLAALDEDARRKVQRCWIRVSETLAKPNNMDALRSFSFLLKGDEAFHFNSFPTTIRQSKALQLEIREELEDVGREFPLASLDAAGCRVQPHPEE